MVASTHQDSSNTEHSHAEAQVMHNEFTAIVEKDDNWFVAYSPEVPGANGQGKTKAESLRNLADAIALILEDRRDDGLRGAPETAEHDIVTIE